MPGPLVEACAWGASCSINELNRLPEGVQNVLLPAIDEAHDRCTPDLGEIRAAEGFLVIATQNPKSLSRLRILSEAILDRFELVVLDYQERRRRSRHRRRVECGPGIRLQQRLLPLAAVRLARLNARPPRGSEGRVGPSRTERR